MNSALNIPHSALSLYIHLPFCKRKCNYCDFVSYAGKEELIDKYVEAVCKELETLTHLHKGLLPLPKGEGIKTIYFGGGTPTLLSPKHFDKIISTIIGHLSFDIGHSETTVEANPGTADKAKLKALRQIGINRLSIGAQSFNNKHLQVLGRIHTAEDVIKFYEDARSVGFDNVGLDLIFALPDQKLSEWQEDTKTAIKLKPEHLSCYGLEGKMAQDNEDLELAMFEHTIEELTSAGFKHYEISNFSKPGCECKHNSVYWRNGNYIGVGAGAHSHVDGKRWANTNSIEEYIQDTRPRTQDHSNPSIQQQETIFMGLRLLDGLEVEKFKGFEKEVKELIEDGLLIQDNNKYKLTRKGLFLANLVFEKFV